MDEKRDDDRRVSMDAHSLCRVRAYLILKLTRVYRTSHSQITVSFEWFTVQLKTNFHFPFVNWWMCFYLVLFLRIHIFMIWGSILDIHCQLLSNQRVSFCLVQHTHAVNVRQTIWCALFNLLCWQTEFGCSQNREFVAGACAAEIIIG